MRKVMLILIFTFFLCTCINSEKSVCRGELVRENDDIESCIIRFGIFQTLPPTYSESIKTFAFNIAIAECLIAIQKEAECNKKSDYIPVLGQGE